MKDCNEPITPFQHGIEVAVYIIFAILTIVAIYGYIKYFKEKKY